MSGGSLEVGRSSFSLNPSLQEGGCYNWWEMDLLLQGGVPSHKTAAVPVSTCSRKKSTKYTDNRDGSNKNLLCHQLYNSQSRIYFRSVPVNIQTVVKQSFLYTKSQKTWRWKEYVAGWERMWRLDSHKCYGPSESDNSMHAKCTLR